MTLRVFLCLFLASFLFSTLVFIAFKCWYILDKVFLFAVLASVMILYVVIVSLFYKS